MCKHSKLKKRFYNTFDKILDERRKYQPEYEKTVEKIWGKPIKNIEALTDESFNIIAGFFKDTEGSANIEYAIFTTVIKAYLKLEEIIILLKSGYPDGAMGISRTLHELTVTLLFIIKNRNHENIVLRYFDYSDVITLKELRVLKEVNDALGDNFEKQSDFEEMEKRESELKSKYGNSFIRDYGWAQCIEGVDGFKAMEKQVGGSALRVFYQMGCNSTHSNSKTNSYSLGDTSKQDRILLVGPSYKGLEFPIRFALASLSAILSGLTSFIDNNKVKAKFGVLDEIIIETLQITNRISKSTESMPLR